MSLRKNTFKIISILIVTIKKIFLKYKDLIILFSIYKLAIIILKILKIKLLSFWHKY